MSKRATGTETKRPSVGGDRQRGILEALRLHGAKTAAELAVLLGGGPVAMRAHLRNLVAAGLVIAQTERQPVGRPTQRFSLTSAADSRFTKQYELFALTLVETLDRLGTASLAQVLQSWEDSAVEYLEGRLPRDAAARVATLAEHQSRFGFMASVEREGEGLTLLERNCPVAAIAARFPQICDHEARAFRRALGQRVELVKCQARGDTVCAFHLDASAKETRRKARAGAAP